MEFLDLTNFDFTTPGSLASRWGSTQYFGQTLPGPITCLTEFTHLSGASYVIFGTSGAIYSGATTGQSQGLSLSGMVQPVYASGFLTATYFGATTAGGMLLTNGFVPRPGGGYYLGLNYPYSPNLIPFFGTGATVSSSNYSFATLNDYLFMADGNNFLKYDGITTTFVGLPPPIEPGFTTIFDFNVLTPTLSIGLTGYYGFYASYVNGRGFEGQIWPLMSVAGSAAAGYLGATNAFYPYMSLVVPPGFGITAINIYSYWNAATLMPGATTFWNEPYVFMQQIPYSAPTMVWISSIKMMV